MLQHVCTLSTSYKVMSLEQGEIREREKHFIFTQHAAHWTPTNASHNTNICHPVGKKAHAFHFQIQFLLSTSYTFTIISFPVETEFSVYMAARWIMLCITELYAKCHARQMYPMLYDTSDRVQQIWFVSRTSTWKEKIERKMNERTNKCEKLTSLI